MSEQLPAEEVRTLVREAAARRLGLGGTGATEPLDGAPTPLAPDELMGRSLASDLGVDSLDVVELVLDVEEATGIELTQGAAGGVRTLDDLVALTVDADQAARGATASRVPPA